jgi:hypothetical protein
MEKDDVKCLNCENKDENIPLIAVRTSGKEKWICVQCLPIIIHKREQLADKLK